MLFLYIITLPYVIYVIICSDDSGLVKLWNIKDNELVGTFEQHDERCWALTCDKSNQDRMITGCAGATITVWKVNKSYYIPFVFSELL